MAKTVRSLNGQVVAITGGARGIGRATAAALIAQGARVAIGDIDAPLAEKTASELAMRSHPPTPEPSTIGLPLDVTDRESFAAFLDETERQLGPLDVLVNNAGIMPVGPFEKETDDCAERLVDINIHGVILGSKLAIERFRPRGRGHIVQLASIAGKGGFPGGATYCATKHAVVGLTEALRSELRGTGIEMHQVLPIGVNTELYSGVAAARGFPTAEPQEVANTIVELLQTGKFELFVPRKAGAITRMQGLMPRRMAEAIIRLTKGDQLLLAADPAARAAYETRINSSASAPAGQERSAA
ncbi:MAG TPA: SDR family oxidoreductase [Solirubrobacteraceae bacterium]|nr:SDR family oxidoreductase [Solirubrobacteraceae bacterium]